MHPFVTLLFLLLSGSRLAAQSADLLSTDEMRTLARAIALVDYPVSQAQFRALTGFKFTSGIGVHSSEDTGDARDVLLFPLTKDSDGGSYRLRLSLSFPSPTNSDRSPQVQASALIYSSPKLGTFILDADQFPYSLAAYLKALLRESGLTIPEFVDSKRWQLHIDEAQKRMRENERRSRKGPNKAPEPTPGAVTPRATSGASK